MIREKLIQGINLLLERKSSSDDPPQEYNELMSEIKLLLEKDGKLSLLRIAYGVIFEYINSPGIQIDPTALRHTKQQLLGEVSVWMMYVFNHDLSTFLDANQKEFLDDIIALIKAFRKDVSLSSDSDTLLLRGIRKQKRELVANHIPSYILAMLANHVTRLPRTHQEDFSSNELSLYYSQLIPTEMRISTLEQLESAEKLLAKLRGEDTLFVSVTHTREGFLFNLH